MSLIIAYIGKKGCVIAADKRRIAFFGEKENRELLEADMYSGDITSDEELYKRAEELDVVLKISDDASKVRTVEDVALGEVTTRGSMETKRKRIYLPMINKPGDIGLIPESGRSPGGGNGNPLQY